MNITNNNFLEFILISDFFNSEELEDFSKIEISITYNCCETLVFTDTLFPVEESESGVESESEDEPIAEGVHSYLQDGKIYISKDLFTNIGITNGIYTITVVFYLDDNIIFETYNCIFVDETIGCTLVSYMATHLGTSKATDLALVYYALKESEDCDCECENICVLYEYLWNNLFNYNPNPCGC